MKLIIYLTLLNILVMTHPSNITFQQVNVKKIDTERILTKKMFSINRIKRQEAHLHLLKGNKANISINFSARPSKNSPYYILQVGYINTDRFEVYDNYRIDRKFISAETFSRYIEILDLEGNYIPLFKR